jgi:hypothetical protein
MWSATNPDANHSILPGSAVLLGDSAEELAAAVAALS